MRPVRAPAFAGIDRRVRLVLLTTKGAATRDALQWEFRTPPPDFAALPEADLKALGRILGRLTG